MNTTGSLSGLAKLHVEARQLTGSPTYPVIVLAGAARPAAAPFLSAKPGRWTCNSGVNSWVCQRDLPVGTVPNDTLDLQWSIPSGILKIDSIRSTSGGWIAYLGSSTTLASTAARDFSVLATNHVKLGDRVQIGAGPIGAGASFESGSNDTIGDLLVKSNVTLRDNALVRGHLTYGGSITISSTAKILAGTDHVSPVLPSIAAVTCTPGANDVTLNTGRLSLAPGAYRNLTVNAGAELVLSGGLYQFNSVTFQANAIVTLNPASTPIDVRASAQMGFGDGMVVRPAASAEPEMVRWSYTGTGTLRVGNGVTHFGWLRARVGSIQLGSRSKVLGGVHASNVQMDPDCHGVLKGIANSAPSIGGTPKDTVTVGKTWQFAPTAVDSEGEALTWSLAKAPTGAVINPATGAISWVADSVRIAPFELKVCDASAACTELLWLVRTTKANSAPVFTPATVTLSGTEGEAWSYASVASDPDGDPLVWSVVGTLPAGMSFNANTHALSWTPTFTQAGSYSVNLKVKAGTDSAIQTINLAIANQNQLPVISSQASASAKEGVPYSYALVVTDPDNDALTFQVGEMPSGMVFDVVTRTFTWTPSFAQAGIVNASVEVNDGMASVSQTWTIGVLDSNRAPVISSSAPTTAKEGIAYSYTMVAEDPDGTPIQIAGYSLAPGMMFDPATRRLDWEPVVGQAGTYPVFISITDGMNVVSQAWTVTVSPNLPPQFQSNAPTETKEGVAFRYELSAVDPDGDALVFSAGQMAPGMTFDATSKALIWQPDFTQAGIYPVSVLVNDGYHAPVEQSWMLMVLDSNRAPEIRSQPALTAKQGAPYSYTMDVFDADGDPIHFYSMNLAPGMVFDDAARRFDWIPWQVPPFGVYPISVTVTDGIHSVVHEWTITVSPNLPPVFVSEAPAAIQEGVPFQHQVLASDPEGDALTYGWVELAPGMTFDAATHSLVWTPGFLQAGTYPVCVMVHDGINPPVEQRWTLQVMNFNLPPVVSVLAPASATVGNNYEATVEVSDPDGEPVHAVLEMAPQGMQYDPARSLIWWTPSPAQVGRHDVRIRVTDPSGEYVVKQFSIEVVASIASPTALVALGGNNKVYLNWLPVSTAGVDYAIYRSESSSGPFVKIGNSVGAVEFADLNLPAGATYFYQVRSEISGQVSSEPTNTAQGIVSSGLRSAPTGFTAIPGNNQVELRWTWFYSGGRTGYEIYRYSGSDVWPSKVGSVSGMASSFTDATVVNGQVYRYFLIDIDQSLTGAGYSSPTSILQVTPHP
ncbi:MAG: putative Ig domain-containing protein [Fibrobacteres bacterium]|nr:putative Ig domain-containing protein [Fibrobacterota bacterium]